MMTTLDESHSDEQRELMPGQDGQAGRARQERQNVGRLRRQREVKPRVINAEGDGAAEQLTSSSGTRGADRSTH